MMVEPDDADDESSKHDKLTATDGITSESDKPRYENENKDGGASVIRSTVGASVATISDSINENMVTVRYASIATIGLLTAYGIANTPFFFRYRTVAEIPATLFRKRRSLRCRLIREVSTESQGPEQPIRLHVRHLSPAEQLLSRTWFDRLMSIHPSATVLGKRPDQSPHELLEIEIAGITTPPEYLVSSYAEQQGEWLRRLVRDRTVVTCQLVARRVRVQRKRTGSTSSSVSSSSIMEPFTKRKAPGLEDFDNSPAEQNVWDAWEAARQSQQRAVCKVYYRPQLMPLFSTDIAESMVRYGRASPSGGGLFGELRRPSQNNTDYYEEKVVDVTDSRKELQKDANYLIRLDRAEYEAAKGSHGMWSDPNIRKSRPDIVEEVEFQTKASPWQKAWRWLRGG